MPLMTEVKTGETVRAPVRNHNRYYKSQKWEYTSTGTGALVLTTSHLGDPGEHPCDLHRVEVDLETSVPASASATLLVKFEAGGEFEDHDYIVDIWTQTLEHHKVDFEHPLPHGAYLELTLEASAVGEVISITALVEWI